MIQSKGNTIKQTTCNNYLLPPSSNKVNIDFKMATKFITNVNTKTNSPKHKESINFGKIHDIINNKNNAAITLKVKNKNLISTYNKLPGSKKNELVIKNKKNQKIRTF